MYIGAGRDVWSGLGVTVLVSSNGVGQSLSGLNAESQILCTTPEAGTGHKICGGAFDRTVWAPVDAAWC